VISRPFVTSAVIDPIDGAQLAASLKAADLGPSAQGPDAIEDIHGIRLNPCP
jgi:hypothetical protein